MNSVLIKGSGGIPGVETQIYRKLGPWILVFRESLFCGSTLKCEWWEIGLVYIPENQE